jgi:LacI family transcriptional regulator
MTAGRKRTPRPVTVHDVARLANVSPMTVSRVVNGVAGVAAATRARVQEAVTRLGFVPNRAARNLRSRRSYWVVLVFQGSRDAQREDPGYVVELQEGVIQRCLERGYHAAVEVLSADSAAARAQLRELAQQLAPDGMLLAPPLSHAPEALGLLQSLHMPCVRIAPGSAKGTGPCVLIDDRAAARQMTEYLLSLGHRRIAFVEGHPHYVASAQRLAGYRAALGAWNIAPDPALVAPGDFTFEGGQRAASLLLEKSPPPTAIFAANDELAAGCLAEAHRRGLRVPGDLSITGFDDTYMATMLYPPLTTVRQSIRDMGHAALEQLLALVDGVTPPQTIRIAHRLVERQSAGAPALDNP